MNLETLGMINDELSVARTKFPKWPADIVHAAAIVAEESGELIRAALHVRYEKGYMAEARREAIQTAVTAIRFIEETCSD